MANVRLFAAAREAAGTGSVAIAGSTVQAVLDAASSKFGEEFATVLASSRVWVNGNEANAQDLVKVDDEVAILPPVSGG